MAEGGPRIIRQRKNGGTLHLIYLRRPQPFHPITVRTIISIQLYIYAHARSRNSFYVCIMYMIFQSSCAIIGNISILARLYLILYFYLIPTFELSECKNLNRSKMWKMWDANFLWHIQHSWAWITFIMDLCSVTFFSIEIFILYSTSTCVHTAYHILLTSNNSTNHACIFAKELL